jgi:hypothetical protein
MRSRIESCTGMASIWAGVKKPTSSDSSLVASFPPTPAYGGRRPARLTWTGCVSTTCGTQPSLWIAAGAGPREVATRAGHTSVSFTLDRYGHLYPEADTALRDRLDALYVAGAQAEPGVVIELHRDASRPQRGPGTR